MYIKYELIEYEYLYLRRKELKKRTGRCSSYLILLNIQCLSNDSVNIYTGKYEYKTKIPPCLFWRALSFLSSSSRATKGGNRGGA